MTTDTLGSLTLALLLLVASASFLGQLAARLRQPKVVGEILAGVLLGPSLLGSLAPDTASHIFGDGGKDPATVVLAFLYNLGLLLLMFVSGASVRNVLGRENRKPTAWIIGLGTPLSFLVVLLVAPLLPLEALTGTAGSRAAVVLVLAIAASVTSIPVITKIFYDLGILHTRFASLMLGVAVLEDIVLWGVLALATAIASATVATGGEAVAGTVTVHVGANVLYVLLAMTVVPLLLRWPSRSRWNVIATQSPIAWVVVVFLGYVSVAAALDVTLAFAAFLAGFGIVGGMRSTEHERFRAPIDAISHVSGAVFIPIYFALVGYQLDFTKGFSPLMLIAFLLGSSVVMLASRGLAARLAGFRRLDIVNVAVTCNARGGPGIVLASVAFDAGIISPPFFTTLVVTAVLTSQACGIWLDFVLRKGWPLLSSEGPVETRKPVLEPVGAPGHTSPTGGRSPWDEPAHAE
jgi:Kef-type K+ transport system membrane component KefB